MDNKKPTGCDGISVKLLKITLPYVAETRTCNYNWCIEKNVFPTAFKRAKVIPLPKTKTIFTDVNDYRPVSILSVLTKPLERHIHKHLKDFLFRNTPSFPFLPVWFPMWTFLSLNCAYPFNWYLALGFQQPSNVRCCVSRLSQGIWPGSSGHFT